MKQPLFTTRKLGTGARKYVDKRQQWLEPKQFFLIFAGTLGTFITGHRAERARPKQYTRNWNLKGKQLRRPNVIGKRYAHLKSFSYGNGKAGEMES